MLILATSCRAFAESARMEFSINVDSYMQIQTLTSPVLIANITDKTGNLYTPLFSKFRVISNSADTKTLYLKANTITENGNESAIFTANGRVYVAFSNVNNKPTSQSLANCKYGASPNESPGVVAYPIASIRGAESKYVHNGGKYEVYVGNGTTDITVNIGSQVLRSSFGNNDPRGFYQATLSLTEADI
jgi:hypothetical protein